MRLTNEKDHMEYLLSPKSLRLHEEYEMRINVLRKLGYIDAESMGIKRCDYFIHSLVHSTRIIYFFWFHTFSVELKGRVACEMGNQNELMVTEMVLNNMLAQCSPEEVAAILSCMVFEAKNIDEPELPDDLALKQVRECL